MNVRFFLSYDIKYTLKSHFLHKKKKLYNFVIIYAALLWALYRFMLICKPLVIYRFYCMALFHPDETSFDKA